MKKFFSILLTFLCSFQLFSKLIVYDIDDSNFPRMKAKVLVFDSSGNVVVDLHKDDFVVIEEGIQREVLSFNCIQSAQSRNLSSVLCIDISGSMGEDNKIDIVKEVAKLWVDLLDPNTTECAITSFDDQFYLNQGFTTNKDLLKKAINSLMIGGGTNYDAAFLGPVLGSIGVAERGRFKKIIIFLSDGQPNFEPKTWEIITKAFKSEITVYAIVVGEPSSDCLKDITSKTGGRLFENVNPNEELFRIFLELMQIEHRMQYCEIEWLSEQQCRGISSNVEIQYLPGKLSDKFVYKLPPKGTAYLKATPSFLKFGEKQVGVPFDTSFTVTAVNRRFEVTDVVSSNPDFVVSPRQFILEDGESIQINITYTPQDTIQTFTKLTFVESFCPLTYFVSGNRKASKINSLVVVHPNGGEVFGLGSDTIITWDKISPYEPVVIEYSTDKGNTWKLLTDSAVGLTWKWTKIPPPASNKCLVRITTKEERSKLIEPFSIDWTLKYDGQAFNWSSQGNYLAFSDFSRVKVVDRNLARVVLLNSHNEKVTGLKFSHDGRYLASCGSDFKVNVWNTQDWSKKCEFLSNIDNFGYNLLTGLDISPDSRLVAAGSSSGNVIIWEIESKLLVKTLSTMGSSITNIEFSPDGRYLAASNSVQQIYIWRTSDWQLVKQLNPSKSYAYVQYFPFKFSKDSKKLVTVTTNAIFVFDTDSWNVLKEFPIEGTSVSAIDLTSSANVLALGTMSGSLNFYNLNNGYLLHRMNITNFIVNRIEITENDTLITCSGNGVIRLYSTPNIMNASPKVITSLVGPSGDISRVKFLGDNNLASFSFYSSSKNSSQTVVMLSKYPNWVSVANFLGQTIFNNSGKNYVSVRFPGGVYSLGYYDLSGNLINSFEIFKIPVYVSDFSPNDQYCILIASQKGLPQNNIMIYVGDFVQMRLDSIPVTSNKEVCFVAFDKKSKFAFIGIGNKVYQLDLETKNIKELFSEQDFLISYLAISPDNSLLVACFNQGDLESRIVVYSLPANDILYQDITFTSAISYVEFSPNNVYLLVLFKDSRFYKILETASFSVVADLSENKGNLVTCGRFSLDGKLLFLGTSSGFLIVRNTEDWSLERMIAAHERSINSIDVSPNGLFLATGGNDNNVVIWNLVGNFDWLNSDVSDSVFSIVPSKISAKNVDMGIAIVGNPKDSVVKNFVVNVGKFRTYIDTVLLASNTGNRFKIISGASGGAIDPGKGLDVEFRFNPILGYTDAEILTVSYGDTLRTIISGFGINPIFDTKKNYLDFGQVTIGDSAIFYDTTLIVNLSDEEVLVDKVEIGGPDFEQFQLVGVEGSFVLPPSEGKKFTVKFVPKYFGFSSSSLLVYHNKFGSPERIRLFGEGVGGKFRIPDDSGYAGETKNIRVLLENITPKGLYKGAKRFEFTLKYQRTILSPPQDEEYEFAGDSVFVKVSGLVDSSTSTLVSIPVTFALGSVPETSVEFAYLTLYGKDDYSIAYPFEKESGKFKLLGICEEGGARLVNTESRFGIEKIQFNNLTNQYEIEFYVAESGLNKIEVYNILGELVTKLWEEVPTHFGLRKIYLNKNLLSKGIHFLFLKSPTNQDIKPFLNE
ncbi:MAG: hypothetical protein CH6_1953 [Candidatus Kapaibacterium sp.]|nr:MAG: hypothetical protein CH6_1953 [Candidatus Kapabacteria bacterium]